MKNFSKLVFTFLFVLAVAPAFSQFSGGVDLGLPTGSLSDVSSIGFGVSLRYEKEIQDKLNWTASVGFASFSGKSYNFSGYSGNYPSITVVPIVGGVKYYFQEANAGFYGGLDLGFFIGSVSVVYPFSGKSVSSSETKFGIAPGIGYRMDKWDFSFRYNSASDLSYAGLRAAYVFGGK